MSSRARAAAASHAGRRAAAAPGLALALALSLLASPGRTRADEPAPDITLRAAPAQIAPTDDGKWPVHLTIVNRAAFGCVLDSVVVDVDPLTPRAGATTRHTCMRTPLVGAVSTADSAQFQIELPAERADSRVRLTACVHTVRTPSFSANASFVGQGYDPALRFPSSTIRVARRDVRLTRVPAGEAADGVGILVLRDADASGDADLLNALGFLRVGYSFVLLDAPGAGAPGGAADPSGPAALAAAQAALDTLAQMPGVTPARLAVWGRRSSAALALLLAERRPVLKAVVAEGASVDPWATYRVLPPAKRAAFVAGAGRDSAGWRARSPLAGLDALRVPALILHGERDARAPAAAAHGFVARLTARGAPVESRFFENAGDSLPDAETLRLVRRFLAVRTR